MDENYTLILFPEFVTLKAEVEKLRTEISMLLLERDELRLVVCKNIETAYMLALGGLEYKAFELHCEVLRLKRKIDLIQAKKNRQEKVVLSVIEQLLDEEFAEYQRQLDEQINKMNKALDHSKGRPLTEEETKALVEKFQTLIAENGEITEVNEWGKRKLAYPINDKPDGYYVLINFKSESTLPLELERIFGITEGIMRSIVIRHEDK